MTSNHLTQPQMSSLIPLPDTLPPFLLPYLPQLKSNELPFITLTYAQSLDSRIAIKPGTQTAISHLETKTMTHYLRSKHDAILVGIGTVLADDPGLDCQFDEHVITPVVLDPKFKFCDKLKNSRMVRTFKLQNGGKPIIIISNEVVLTDMDMKELVDVRIVKLPLNSKGLIEWSELFKLLKQIGLQSVMVEGGARVINDLLVEEYQDSPIVNSLVITMGPVYLGSGGVEVSPFIKVGLQNVKWWTGVQDAVVAAKLESFKS